MEEKLRGVVISAVQYGENDKMLNIFTLEKGMVSSAIKGVKKAGAKLKFASEPFSFVEFVFATTGDKRRVINASLIDSFYPIRENIEKYYSAGAMLEFVRRFFREEIVSEQTFIQLINGLKQLAYGSGNPLEICAEFIFNCLKTVGYGLNVSPTCQCGQEIKGRVFFDFNSASFRCSECAMQEDREINFITFGALGKIEEGERLTEDQSLKVVRLLDFYLQARAEVKINSLAQLIELKTFNG